LLAFLGGANGILGCGDGLALVWVWGSSTYTFLLLVVVEKKNRISSPLLVFRERQKPVVKGFLFIENRHFFKKHYFSMSNKQLLLRMNTQIIDKYSQLLFFYFIHCT
jgi:hypothetical protein